MIGRGSAAAMALVIGAAACARTGPAVVEEPRVETPTPAPTPVVQEAFSSGPVRPIYSSQKSVSIPVEDFLAGDGGTAVWINADGGRTWIEHSFHEGRPPSVTFSAPAEGVYGVVLVPVDKDGRRAFVPTRATPHTAIVAYDPTPPAVEVLAPNGGEILGGAKTTEISWVAEDPHLGPTPITLMASNDGGANWTVIQRHLPNVGRHAWTTPRETSTTFRIRVVAEDLAGNSGHDASDANVTIDADAPAVRVIGPASAVKLPVALEYRPVELGGSELARVRLFLTKDQGATWTEVGEDPDLTSPFDLNVLSGVYGVWLAADDVAGNRGSTPAPGARPQAQLVVDTTPPTLTLVEPAGAVHAGGRALDVRWVARDNIDLPERCVSIWFSDDGGKTWRAAGEGLTNNGLFSWAAPAVGGDRYRLKIVVRDTLGNAQEALSPVFALDVEVPEAVATVPARSRLTEVPVAYELLKRGFSPVTQATLWFRPTGQKAWTRYGDDEDLVSPILFRRTDGDYEIFMTCSTELGTRSGLRQGEPAEGAAAQARVMIDATPPELTLRSFDGGGAVAAERQAAIQWTFKDAHPAVDGLTIEYSPDGGANWSEVASKLDPAAGAFDWKVPAQFGRSHLLRLRARDLFGNETVVVTARPFVIDREAPRIQVAAAAVPSPSRARGIDIAYEATDDLPSIDRVEAYARPQGAPGEYQPMGVERAARGVMHVELPRDGKWELVLVAVDGTGRRTPERINAVEPHVRVTVDTQPPEVKIERRQSERSGESFYVDERGELRWAAKDSLGEVTLRIRFAGEDGLWRAYPDEKIANKGFYACREFLRPGHPVRLQLVARDEAGNEATDETPLFTVPMPEAARYLSMTLDRKAGAGDIHPGEKLAFRWEVSDTGEPLLEQELQVAVPGHDFATVSRRSPKETSAEYTPVDTIGEYAAQVRARDGYGRVILSGLSRFRVEGAPIGAVKIAFGERRETYDIGAKQSVLWSIDPPQQVKEAHLERRAGPNDDWQRMDVDLLAGPVQIHLPTEPTQTFYRISIRDLKDRRGFSEEMRVLTKLPEPLRITLRARPDTSVQAGDVLWFGWDVIGDKTLLRSVALEQWSGAGKPIPVRTMTPADSGVSVRAPDVLEGEYSYRINAKDITDKSVVSNLLTIKVEARKLRLSAVLHGKFVREAGSPVTVGITPPAGTTIDPTAVRIRIRPPNAQTPVEIKPFRADAKEVVFFAPGEQGSYFFTIEAASPGRRLETIEMEISVAKPDVTAAPKIEILNFRGGQRVGGGMPQAIMVKVAGAATMESLEVSLSRDGGARWDRVEESALRRDPGGWIEWTPPRETGKTFRLKVAWGPKPDLAFGMSEDFIVESRPPKVTVAAPAGPSGDSEIPLKVEVDRERHDAARSLVLYTTWMKGAGRTWQRQAGEFKAGEPVVLKVPQAKRPYAVYVVATTELGLSNPPPGPDTAPMAEGFVFDPAAIPEPKDPSKRVYRAAVEADTDDEPAPKPAPKPEAGIEKDDE